MMDLGHGLWWLSIVAEGAALASILARGLAQSYRWFTFYLTFGIVRDVTLNFCGDPSLSDAYALAWMASEPFSLALLFLATNEIVGKVPGHYRGFGNFGQKRLRYLLDLALAGALLSSVIEASGPQWDLSQPTLLRLAFAVHRITTSTLAVYLVLVAFFVSRVPVSFQRNLRIHSRLFACYLSFQTGVMLAAVIIGHATPAIGNLVTGGSAVLFLLWAVLLTRAGEALPERITLTAADVLMNEQRERDLQDTARRYSDRPLG